MGDVIKTPVVVFSEIVLPSGRFASFRRLRGWDLLGLELDKITDPHLATALLLTRAVKIDGESITLAQIMEMDLADVLPLSTELAKMLKVGVL